MGTVTELRKKTTSMGEILKTPPISRGFVILMICLVAWGSICAILKSVIMA